MLCPSVLLATKLAAVQVCTSAHVLQRYSRNDHVTSTNSGLVETLKQSHTCFQLNWLLLHSKHTGITSMHANVALTRRHVLELRLDQMIGARMIGARHPDFASRIWAWLAASKPTATQLHRPSKHWTAAKSNRKLGVYSLTIWPSSPPVAAASASTCAQKGCQHHGKNVKGTKELTEQCMARACVGCQGRLHQGSSALPGRTSVPIGMPSEAAKCKRCKESKTIEPRGPQGLVCRILAFLGLSSKCSQLDPRRRIKHVILQVARQSQKLMIKKQTNRSCQVDRLGNPRVTALLVHLVG